METETDTDGEATATRDPKQIVKTVVSKGEHFSHDPEEMAHELNDWVEGWLTTWKPLQVHDLSIYRLHGCVVMTAYLMYSGTA